MSTDRGVSVIIPARDEAGTIEAVIRGVRAAAPQAEIIVVNDGSSDATAALAAAQGARVVSHPYVKGNGAAVKTGARAAEGEVLVFLDADGQHDPADIPKLLNAVDAGFDLAVGARTARSQATFWRLLGNWGYNRLASWIVGQRVMDLTSGFRAARAELFREFLHLLPNGFSYPTTSTIAFYRAGYSVTFVPVPMGRRSGRSHIRLFRDGGRFLLIIFRVGTLYSPLKIFFPVSLACLAAGIGYYAFTFLTQGRLTNFGALLFLASLIVFLIGLVSEQITTLIYLDRRKN